MNENIKKRMTPRQQIAVSNPIADPGAIPHPRHHRRNGNVQSYLTFDVSEISSLDGEEDEIAEIVERSVEGWYGAWHARVSHSPVRRLDAWSPKFIEAGKAILLGIMVRVGMDINPEIHNGSDLKSVHVWKWATHEELQLARAEAGMSFEDLRKAQIAESRIRAMAERRSNSV